MKKITMILFIVFAISSTFAQDSAKKTDPKLFGSWSGSEIDGQIKGMTKNWIIRQFLKLKDTKSNRFYRLLFSFQYLLFGSNYAFHFINFGSNLKH